MFREGDYAFVARPRKVSTLWFDGLGRKENSCRESMYVMMDIVSGQLVQVHVGRVRLYSDASLSVADGLVQEAARVHRERELRMSSSAGKLISPHSWHSAGIHCDRGLARLDAREDGFCLVLVYLSSPSYPTHTRSST